MIRIKALTHNLQEYAVTPVSVLQLKLLLQLEGTAYDDQLQMYLWAATTQIEQYTNTSLTAKTVICTFEQRDCNGVRLPLSPIDEILTVKWKKCPLQFMDACYEMAYAGYADQIFVGSNNSGSMPYPTYRVEYTTTPADNYALDEAVKQQAAFLYNNRDEPNPGVWSPLAKGLADANKYGNY